MHGLGEGSQGTALRGRRECTSVPIRRVRHRRPILEDAELGDRIVEDA